MYDIFAGREALESSYFLTRSKALEAFPMLKKDELVGALVYYDGKYVFIWKFNQITNFYFRSTQ
jgi:glycerol-3-phosphate dehydrogenase